MANKIRDAFDNVQAEPHLVESTKQFLSKERGKNIRRTPRPAVQIALAAVCIIVVLAAGAGGYTWSQIPVSYVGIDVNPSIELALNRFDKVVSVKAYNAEGEEVIKELALKGKSYTKAIDLIVESEGMGAYLAEGAELVFTVAADRSREMELKAGVERCAGHSQYKSQSASVDIDTVSEAHDNGISLGKYYAWRQLIQYDDTVTADACKDMSMSEIHDLISGHEKEHENGHEGSDSHPEEDHVEPENHIEEDSHIEQEQYVEDGNHINQQNNIENENHIRKENHPEDVRHTRKENSAEDGNQINQKNSVEDIEHVEQKNPAEHGNRTEKKRHRKDGHK